MRRIVCTLDRGLQYSKWCIKLSYTCIQSQLSAHEQRQSFFSTRNIEFQRDLPVVRIYHRLQKNLTSQPFPVSLPSAFATGLLILFFPPFCSIFLENTCVRSKNVKAIC